MHDKPSLFGCQGDYQKLKITSKKKTISQISCSWDNILWTLTLDCGPSSFYSSIARCLPVSSWESHYAHLLCSRGIKAKERLFGCKIISNLVVKWGFHCAYTNENYDNGNQKVTSQCGVSFEQKSFKIILSCSLFLVPQCYRSVELIYTNKELFRVWCVLH